MQHQEEALRQLSPGKILYGNVGTGKSLTALQYYAEKESPAPLFVITTAKKRDSLEWLKEASRLGIGTSSVAENPAYPHGILTVDSWNQISQYESAENAFFIFDEQRLVGHGAWVKSFLKIAKRNRWIMLTATPGDTWLDYAPVFIANGWYKNITDFKREHVLYAPYVRYPKVLRYLGEEKLERYRNEILVEAPYVKHTIRHLNYIDVGYDKSLHDWVVKTRWNPYEDAPMLDVAELFRVLRQVVNSDPSRMEMVHKLMNCHPRLIIFYNFNYELRLLRELYDHTEVGEWNGQKKTAIPSTKRWAYLVQYQAGGEGWNCISTDTMILYSLPYSYKAFVQSQGRIDRLNTPYVDLYYYILKSSAPIDYAVKAVLDRKENFNVRKEYPSMDELHLSNAPDFVVDD